MTDGVGVRDAPVDADAVAVDDGVRDRLGDRDGVRLAVGLMDAVYVALPVDDCVAVAVAVIVCEAEYVCVAVAVALAVPDSVAVAARVRGRQGRSAGQRHKDTQAGDACARDKVAMPSQRTGECVFPDRSRRPTCLLQSV